MDTEQVQFPRQAILSSVSDHEIMMLILQFTQLNMHRKYTVEFAIAVLTKDHRLHGLKQQKHITLQFFGIEFLKIKVSAAFLSGGCRL